MSAPHLPSRAAAPAATASRRVRHQLRDAVAVMAFSAVASTALVAALLLVASAGR